MKHVPTTVIHTTPSTIFNNNNGVVFLSKEAAIKSRSKHINIRHHFIRDLVRDKVMTPAMIDNKEMPADFLTKAANSVVLHRCLLLVGNIGFDEVGL